MKISILKLISPPKGQRSSKIKSKSQRWPGGNITNFETVNNDKMFKNLNPKYGIKNAKTF